MGTYGKHPFLPAPSFIPKPPNPHLQYYNSSPYLFSLRSLFCSLSSHPAPSQPSHSPSTNNYNHLIQSLCKQGNLRQALKLIPQEPNPTQRTYEFLILACTRQNARSYAPAIVRHLIDDGFDHDPFLSTKLIGMYSHFRSIDDARHVFDRTPEKTIFVWNAFLKALLLADEVEEALSLFRDIGRSGVSSDSFSYSYALKACVASCLPESVVFNRVREIHGHAIRAGYDSRIHVATTLVDCYGKIGGVICSRKVFDEMPHRNVVSWSAMIACYAKNGRHFDALEIFRGMMMLRNPEIVPNSVTMVSVLQACAGLAAMGQGKLLHCYVLRRGIDSTVSVVNALISMYIKCGNLDAGRRIFDSRMSKDVVTWNSMISGYGVHGFGNEAIQVFEEMIREGITPSSITFVSVLGACSHAGLVEEGRRLLESMEKEHNLIPESEHYACMVDLLGRAGRLDEAAKIIEGMEFEPGPTVWGSLLGACRIHGSIELAEKASSHLFELEPKNAGNYVLLADIYAEAKMWEEVNRVRKLLEERELQKLPGCSWIEVEKKLYSFVSVDGLNPQTEEVHALLAELVKEVKGMGYTPDTRVVLYDLEQDEKEKIVMGHSEKLALAFGLIRGGKGEVIRITKNLRLCEDCHSLTKFISKFTKREILVRDVNRFHHFRDGACSCLDYW
uniref:Chlororespiratory reduction 2 n=1 Tax=Apostasia odorata TaxID=280455 RepID=A0A1S6YFZ1_9ASPA|nr:chlororespiratory reduction 2 [Apostasia odorata]